MRAPRIVSLLPSATEIVAALGLTERLVGRSHACDYPAEIVAVERGEIEAAGGAPAAMVFTLLTPR